MAVFLLYVSGRYLWITASHNQKKYNFRIDKRGIVLRKLLDMINLSHINPKISRGYQMMSKGQLLQALRIFQEALHESPNDPEAILAIARCMSKMPEPKYKDRVASFYHKYLTRNPRDYEVRKELCKHFLEKGDIKQAKLEQQKTTYLKNLENDPKNPNLLNKVGRILLVQEQNTEAIKCFKQAVAFDPNFIRAQFNLALAWYKIALDEKSQDRIHYACHTGLSIINRANSTVPSVSGHVLIGKIQLHLGEIELAEASLLEARKTGPESNETEHLESMIEWAREELEQREPGT